MEKTFEMPDISEHIDRWKKEMERVNPEPTEHMKAIKRGREEMDMALGKDEAKKFIRRFPSNAVRSDDTGRERPDFISPYATKAVGEHFAGNSNDFGATNYWLGIPEIDVIASISRHFLDLQIAIYEGNTELVRKEWQALTANCIMGLHTHEIIRLGLYKEVHEKTELVEVK